MNHDRRAFLRSSSLAAFAALLTPRLAIAKAKLTPGVRQVRSVSFTAEDERLLQWVASYSSEVRVVGASILGRLRGVQTTTRIFAKIPDVSVLDAILAPSLPLTEVYAKGNVFIFTYDGARYEVENLLPELFASRLAKLAKQAVFGYDALTYDPVTKVLRDPFKALTSGALTIVHAGSGIASAFENILRAWVESDQLGLKLGPSFFRLKKRVLSVPGTRPALAQSVASTFVARLPQLSDLLSSEQVSGLLQSRLIRTAIVRVLGVDAATVLAQLEARRGVPVTDAEADVAAILLGGLLSKQLEQGIVPDWFGGLDIVAARRARAALDQAYIVVQNSVLQDRYELSP